MAMNDPHAGGTPGATPPVVTPSVTRNPDGTFAPALETELATAKQELEETRKQIENMQLEQAKAELLRKAQQLEESRADAAQRRKALREAESKIATFESEKTEAQRKQDEEAGNWKKLYEEQQSVSAAERQRTFREAVRAQAISEGIVNKKIADLIPLEALKVSETGTILGVEEAVAAFKSTAPEVFKAADTQAGSVTPTTSPTVGAPAAGGQTTAPAKVKEMTAEEYTKAKAEALAKLK